MRVEEFKDFLIYFEMFMGRVLCLVYEIVVMVAMCYVINMAGRQWVCGWSPTGRNGGYIYIEIEMDASVDRRADDVFTV